ncbi:MAG: DUF1048 domain-containing protein [Clostridium sp.]|nr:DUF1048 domain-containing protein [Clostridium sp.]
MNEVDKMIRENYEMSKKLNEENQKIYTDIVCYIRVSSFNSKEKEEVISDILEMFLRYQSEDKPVESAIGHDYKAFCDSIVESSHSKFSIDTIKENVNIIINGIFILLSIDFVLNYIPNLIKTRSVINYHINLSTIIVSSITMISAYGIVKYIGKTSFKYSSKKLSKLQKFLFGASFAAFSLCLGFISYFLKGHTIFSLNAYIMFGVLAIYWMYILIKPII